MDFTPHAKKAKAIVDLWSPESFDGDGWDELRDDDLPSVASGLTLTNSQMTRLRAHPPGANAGGKEAVPPPPPPPPPCANLTPTKGKGKGKGENKKQEKTMKVCNVGNERLPMSMFKEARNVCAEDDEATESLQRLLRKRWAKHTRLQWPWQSKIRQSTIGALLHSECEMQATGRGP